MPLLLPLMFPLALAAGSDPLATTATLTRLPNGLTVILEEQKRADQVAIFVRYGVGSKDQAPGQGGCAHLFEHLMFEGSKNVPAGVFDDLLTAAGGENNAWTEYDQTVYHETIPSGALDLAFYLESDRMGWLDAGVVEENVKNQQDVVLRERAEGYASPHGRDWDAMGLLLYPEGHPYHTPIIGTEADIRAFQVDQVRAFWQESYYPANAVLTVVGNIDTAATLAAIQTWFAEIPSTRPARPAPAPVNLLPEPQNALLEDAVEDWTVYLTWPGPVAYTPDAYALDLAMRILSDGPGTRLDDALYYDRRLASAVTTDFWPGLLGGPITVMAATPKPKLKKAAKLLEKTTLSLVSQPPTVDELARAKASARSDLLDAVETPEGRAEWLTTCQVYFGRPDCLHEIAAATEAVTSAQIAQAIQTYVTPQHQVNLSVIPAGRGGALPGATPVELQ